MIRGATPHELAFGRTFAGELCEFGKPVFAYVIPATKATAKWKRMLFLGKTDIQNSYVLFDGQSIVISENVRRLSTTWRAHMAYYLHCKCFFWQYKSGFGARILPTMKKPIPKAVGFDAPLGPIEENKMYDKDADDVIKHAEQEQKAEQEQLMMSAHDPLSLALREKLGEGAAGEIQREQADEGPVIPMSSAPLQIEAPSSSAVGSAVDQQMDDPGLMVPVTPPRDYIQVDSPRMSPSTRPSDDASEETLKRQRTEEAKKQRINQLRLEYEQRLSAVKVAYREYFPMDHYSPDLDMDGDTEEEVWAGEKNISLTEIPDHFWSDAPAEYPPDTPEKWADELADKVEIQRLCQMQVLVPAAEFSGEVTGSLTTKFVRDWRLKDFGEGADMRKRWMRRSRFVAREFANTRRLDTFSLATGAHTANILPFKYLWMKGMTSEMKFGDGYSVIMAALDVRDAFLQVEQDEPILVHLQGEPFIIKCNLPGQSLGAKQWYLHGTRT